MPEWKQYPPCLLHGLVRSLLFDEASYYPALVIIALLQLALPNATILGPYGTADYHMNPVNNQAVYQAAGM